MKDTIIKQNLGEKAHDSGVYMMWFLFKEKVPMPSQGVLLERLKAHFGSVDVVSGMDGLMSFALKDHVVTYQGGERMPSQVMIIECNPVKEPFGDEIARTQFWDCPGGEELLDSCPWQVLVSDFMARGLPALERADVLAGWLEICLSLFPQCEAVYFAPSGKLLTADRLRENRDQGQGRFLFGGVNARFFNIQGTNDMIVDTLGLYALGLPDVQYHFYDLDPNEVVQHAYNTALYQFENGASIEMGDTIEGITPGSRWICEYEDSLVQPSRLVLDIAAGEFAAGDRER